MIERERADKIGAAGKGNHAELVIRALADELLFGRLIDGGRLTVGLDEKEDGQLDIQPLPKKESRSSKSEPAEPEEAEAS